VPTVVLHSEIQENHKLNICVMSKSQGIEKFLIIARGMLLLSILLMMVVIPGVYTRSLPDDNNTGAVIGISLAIIVRLLLVFWYTSIIKSMKHEGKMRKRACIVSGILLIIFGLIYLDGAFAFLDNKNILYVSYLMFTSVFFDLIASILTFIVALFKSQKIK
jgi:hypothetical protein